LAYPIKVPRRGPTKIKRFALFVNWHIHCSVVPRTTLYQERRISLKNLKSIIAGGILAGTLIFLNVPALADHETKENPGLHKGWEKKHQGWAKGHDKKKTVADDRAYIHSHAHDRNYDLRNSASRSEVREGIRDVRAARRDVRQDREQLQRNQEELKKDKAELRADIRNGARKKEIRQDRREIRADLEKLADSKKELRRSENRLEAARKELREDLRKR
jgi:hypothetical protein